MSPERRAECLYDRAKSLLMAMTDVDEINLEDQERLADQVRRELTLWLDYVRQNCEPSVTQPDIAFAREHVCESAKCCKRASL